MHRTVALLLSLFLLCACRTERAPVTLPARTVDIVAGQSVLIQMKSGEILVRGGEDGQVRVEGQTISPDQAEINVETLNDQIRIFIQYTGRQSSNAPLHIEVSMPDDVPLKIETDSAAIAVHDYRGRLDAESISGSILIENANGEITVHSNRGDVQVWNSIGTMSLVGNYGLLSIESSSGEIGVSTIMGRINFSGSIQANDAVRLETDHGPVAVKFSPDSDLNYQVSSNSGDVACMLPDVTATLRTCQGVLKTGSGSLNIRTVSGAVTLQLIP